MPTSVFEVDTTGVVPPKADGDIIRFKYREAVQSEYFDGSREVIFVNGMGNAPADHVKSALALSLVQMCTVVGVYNQSGGFVGDLIQCVADKNQFNGVSLSASNAVNVRRLFAGQTSAQAARDALSRNAAQLALFDLLRERGRREIFAHSQGNLITSNALQALAAVDGPAAVTGLVVNTFGSPAVNWPKGIITREHGFTFDPVNWLSGFDRTWSISKLGWPSGSWNPITHGFLQYMHHDPSFLVNRFRVGSFGMTFNMDEAGLADALVAMGPNLQRVHAIFQHLANKHSSDADDVAELYVEKIRSRPQIIAAFRNAAGLKKLLSDILGSGVVFARERAAISFLKSL